MLKVLIVEDQEILRDTLKFTIERDPEIQVTGCAANGREAFELCHQLLPDVVLMDIIMPVCDGIEGTRLIKTQYNQIKVIILTTFDDRDKIAAALANGADGYILKEVSAAELIMAVKSATRGFGIIHKKTYDTILNQFSSHTVPPNPPVNRSIDLTSRELSIIRYISEGKNNREIANLLFVGEGRVKNIVTSILKKLNVGDRAQLVIYAIKNDLV